MKSFTLMIDFLRTIPLLIALSFIRKVLIQEAKNEENGNKTNIKLFPVG